MPTVSISSLRFSRLSVGFTYLSVNHTRDDLAEIADPGGPETRTCKWKEGLLKHCGEEKASIC